MSRNVLSSQGAMNSRVSPTEEDGMKVPLSLFKLSVNKILRRLSFLADDYKPRYR
jgi:hypothetical protein